MERIGKKGKKGGKAETGENYGYKGKKGRKENCNSANNSHNEFISKKILNFYKLKDTNSFISCHGRPTGKDLKFFKGAYHMNFVLTLQNHKEKPEEIKKICDENGIRWHQIELFGANLPYFEKRDTQRLIISNLSEIYKILKNEKIILFIHCAAGVHRTGTVVYSLLRVFGESPVSAMEAIKYIRLETHTHVGDSRIIYAEKYIVPGLFKSVYGEDYEMFLKKENSFNNDVKVIIPIISNQSNTDNGLNAISEETSANSIETVANEINEKLALSENKNETTLAQDDHK